jgi:6-phosphogluconolactonase
MTGGPGAASGDPEILVLPTPDDASHVAANRIAEALIAAVDARGVAHWATTGGSTPGRIYRHLADAPWLMAVPWDRVHLWWGDDRWVPPEDILSNALACWDLLLRDVPVPIEQVHVMPIGDAMAGGEGPDRVAEAYEAALRDAAIPLDPDGIPMLDVVLVGVGTDGHLFSVFPGSSTWDDPHWVQPVPAPTHIAPHVDRVTLHPGFVTATRLPIAVVLGPAKASIIGELFGGPRDPRRLPAQLAVRAGAVWILDEGAASGLPAGAAARAERPMPPSDRGETGLSLAGLG